jgi:CheY-like chemotaxis protein
MSIVDLICSKMNNFTLQKFPMNPFQPFHVLLADDDHDDRKFFADALGKLNVPFKLSDFRACEELLSHINEETTADIIFLDLNMPYLNGHECLQEIRKNKKYDAIPVAIYTTSSNRKDIDTTYDEGANIYVIKPNRFDEIVYLLQDIFSSDLKRYIHTKSREKFVLKLRKVA